MFVVKHTKNKNSCIKTLKSEGGQALSPEVPIVSEGPSRSVLMHVKAYRHFYKNGIIPYTLFYSLLFSLLFSHILYSSVTAI